MSPWFWGLALKARHPLMPFLESRHCEGGILSRCSGESRRSNLQHGMGGVHENPSLHSMPLTPLLRRTYLRKIRQRLGPMIQIPTLITDRLILRPFTLADAPRVQELAGAWEIAETTANIPHPYTDGMAETWISSHQAAFDAGESLTLAITLKSDGALVGAVGLHFQRANHLAELGYWVGKPFWNHGYCSEAAKEVVGFGFEQMNLNRIQARHMVKNPASGRVMEKIDMKKEGVLRQSLSRWGKFEDVAMYSVLKKEFSAAVS